MSTCPLDEIVLKELAAFAASFGIPIEVCQLHRYAYRISAQIANNGQPPKEDKLLSRKHCAELLGVSLPTLDRYIRQEGLPFRVKNLRAKHRVHYIFLERDVLKWAESHLSGFRNRRGPK